MMTVIVLGIAFPITCVIFGLIYLFRRDLYRRIDELLDEFIGDLMTEVALSVAIIITAGGLIIVVYQVYTLSSLGQWPEMTPAILIEEGASSQILSFVTWFWAFFNLEEAVTYLLETTPLSIFLILTGALITMGGAAIRGKGPAKSR